VALEREWIAVLLTPYFGVTGPEGVVEMKGYDAASR
jgi:hypothetical protein